MPEPISIVEPSAEEIVAKYMARGVTAAGVFPLSPDKRYALMLVRVDSDADMETISAAMSNIDKVQAGYLVGDHTTRDNVPEGQQIEAQVKVRIRMNLKPEDEPEI